MALEVTQVKSSNGAKHNQLATLESLGLRRMRHTVVVADRPEIRGMVATVNHLVAVREVADGTTVGAHASRALSSADAGESGVVGDAGGASAHAEEMLEEQGHAGKGVDAGDLVQHARQDVPDGVTVKVPAGPTTAAEDTESAGPATAADTDDEE